MANKTQPTTASVTAYLDSLPDPARRADCYALLELMERVSGAPAILWGSSIIGFGRYSYRYKSGHSGEWPLTGFAPRKRDLTVYITSGFDHFPDLMARLGTYKTGVSCLYIKRLADVDLDVLEELVRRSVDHMVQTNPT